VTNVEHFSLYFSLLLNFDNRFLYDKSCEQYRSYSDQLLDYKQQRAERQREREHQKLSRDHQPQATEQTDAQQHREEQHSNSAADKYDPESAISADFDSDDEYMRGMMDRNRDNIKRRIECRNELSDEERREREEAASGEPPDGDDQDDQDDKESQRQRRKRERKSRWGEKEQQLPSSSMFIYS